MEILTYQEQNKRKFIVPKIKYTAFIMQALYNKVYKRTTQGKVVQAMIDLSFVKDDFQAGIDGCNFIGKVKYGFTTPDQFIVNKDLDTYSITSSDTYMLFTGIRKMHKTSPEV